MNDYATVSSIHPDKIYVDFVGALGHRYAF
jgi:hypothetical protein